MSSIKCDYSQHTIISSLLLFLGRGLKNGENFQLLYDLAGKLNAAGILIILSLHVRFCY